MNRLVTFGCSNTFGHGLPDCIAANMQDPGPLPSKLGYAQMLADHLGRSLVNLSVCGAGDKQIMNIANNATLNPNDICLIQWSHNDRHCVIKKLETANIGPWHNTKMSKTYYKHIYDEHDATIMRAVYINYINLKLQSNGVKTYNILPVDATPGTLDIRQTFIMSDKNLHNFRVDWALDNTHSGEKSQRLFTDYLINKYF